LSSCTNSNLIYQFAKEHKFTSEKKLHIIGKDSSNGIDLERFSRSILDEKLIKETKDKINHNSNNTYILSVGRIGRAKGIVELVEAFSIVKSSFKNLKLILVGIIEIERELLPTEIIKKKID
jgi:glycosyltransferase involved in cell wall biosynthesis